MITFSSCHLAASESAWYDTVPHSHCPSLPFRSPQTSPYNYYQNLPFQSFLKILMDVIWSVAVWGPALQKQLAGVCSVGICLYLNDKVSSRHNFLFFSEALSDNISFRSFLKLKKKQDVFGTLDKEPAKMHHLGCCSGELFRVLLHSHGKATAFATATLSPPLRDLWVTNMSGYRLIMGYTIGLQGAYAGQIDTTKLKACINFPHFKPSTPIAARSCLMLKSQSRMVSWRPQVFLAAFTQN